MNVNGCKRSSWPTCPWWHADLGPRITGTKDLSPNCIAVPLPEATAKQGRRGAVWATLEVACFARAHSAQPHSLRFVLAQSEHLDTAIATTLPYVWIDAATMTRPAIQTCIENFSTIGCETLSHAASTTSIKTTVLRDAVATGDKHMWRAFAQQLPNQFR